MDRTFGNHNEDHSSDLESKPNTTRVLPSKLSASIFSDEVVQDEEEAKYSTQLIRIVESLLVVSPSPVAPEVYEIFDISYSHIDDPEEHIWISIVE